MTGKPQRHRGCVSLRPGLAYTRGTCHDLGRFARTKRSRDDAAAWGCGSETRSDEPSEVDACCSQTNGNVVKKRNKKSTPKLARSLASKFFSPRACNSCTKKRATAIVNAPRSRGIAREQLPRPETDRCAYPESSVESPVQTALSVCCRFRSTVRLHCQRALPARLTSVVPASWPRTHTLDFQRRYVYPRRRRWSVVRLEFKPSLFVFQVTKWDTEQYGNSTTTITTTNAKTSNRK